MNIFFGQIYEKMDFIRDHRCFPIHRDLMDTAKKTLFHNRKEIIEELYIPVLYTLFRNAVFLASSVFKEYFSYYLSNHYNCNRQEVFEFVEKAAIFLSKEDENALSDFDVSSDFIAFILSCSAKAASSDEISKYVQRVGIGSRVFKDIFEFLENRKKSDSLENKSESYAFCSESEEVFSNALDIWTKYTEKKYFNEMHFDKQTQRLFCSEQGYFHFEFQIDTGSSIDFDDTHYYFLFLIRIALEKVKKNVANLSFFKSIEEKILKYGKRDKILNELMNGGYVYDPMQKSSRNFRDFELTKKGYEHSSTLIGAYFLSLEDLNNDRSHLLKILKSMPAEFQIAFLRGKLQSLEEDPLAWLNKGLSPSTDAFLAKNALETKKVGSEVFNFISPIASRMVSSMPL